MTRFSQKLERCSTMIDRLDDVRMSPSDRARAIAYIQQAESFVSFVVAAAKHIRRFIAVFQRGITGLSRTIKVMFVKPVRR